MRTPVRVARLLFAGVIRDDVAGLAAELAYRFFLALFPFAIFLAALGAFVARLLNIANPVDQITSLLADAMPPQATDVLGGELRRVFEHADPGLLSVGAVTALIAATGGTNALIKAMNRALELDETRPLWRRYLLAAGLTVLGGSALILGLAVFAAGQVVGSNLAARIGLEGAFWPAVSVARWPLLGLVLAAAVVVLYRLGPNGRLPIAWILPGSLLFAVTWLAALAFFSFFVTRIASYGATYGALAGVAVLLIWLYLSSYILLVGFELGGVQARLHAEEPPVEVAGTEDEGGASPAT